MQYVGDKTYGISGIYFDKEHVFVSSSNFPSYVIGKFSTDDSVGPNYCHTKCPSRLPKKR